MEKPRVGILTTFYNFDRAYSLTSVVESQLVSLVKHGYNPVLFVLTGYKDDPAKIPQGVEVRAIVPQFPLFDYSTLHEPLSNLEEQVIQSFEAFREHTKDIDIIFQHDLIFQGWFLPYAAAIHKLAQEEPRIKWFHWMHSAPSARPKEIKRPHWFRFNLPPRSKLVYLNNFHMLAAGEMYGVLPADVRVIYNPVDTRLYWNMHPLVRNMIEKYDLLSAHFMQVYPVSTTRMVAGKRIDVVIDIFGKLKAMGFNVRLVLCNAHANDKREKQVVSEMQSFAAGKGLGPHECIFTSLEQPPDYELGVPREVVSDLMKLGNLFIFPSISENCPLTLLEAMMSKQILVLNNNVGSMRELAQDAALYFDFGSVQTPVDYENRDRFMEDVARIIVGEYNKNRVLKGFTRLKQDFNFDRIFKKQIEPLFYEKD